MRSFLTGSLARALAAGVLMFAMADPAAAQFRKPDDAIKYRQSVMFTMGNHFYSRLGAMANGRIPFEAKAAADNADIVVMLSKLPWIAFGPGTDQGDTDAKPAVWSEPARFKEASEKMQAEVLKLQAASRGSDFDAFRAQYRVTSDACKACHDKFTSQ